MKKSLSKTISCIRFLMLDEDCERMSKSHLVGYLGELLVKAKLEDEGFDVNHRGKQSSFDLQYGENKIDVKTSTMKNEDSFLTSAYWGWALDRNKHSGRLGACTHFICVALTESFKVEAFYIIKMKYLKRFRSFGGQFNKVNRAFRIPCAKTRSLEKLISPRLKLKKRRKVISFYQNCLDLLKTGKIIKVLPSGKLSRYM
jgi:hypothetical protein